MADVTTSGPHAVLPDAVRAYGKYFLVRKLAEGGMAEIFLAKQVGAEGFERNVVIKRMLAHLSAVPDFVGMFLDEARLAARLGHPNVIQINDLGLADGCYYICMEYLPGEDFSTVLRTASKRREYVPLTVVGRIVIEAAHGLHFAHEFADEAGKPLNIVHRDISPSNIYVTYQGQAKLLDFGIAKAESRVTQTTAGVVKGKYMYMSPEQAGTGIVDRRSDVFSLGVTLYEALTNTRPFARDNDLAILNAVLKGDFRPPRQVRPDLPPELELVVMKAMALRREDRYSSAGEMAVDLEKYLGSMTSATGGTHIATYLRQLFGEERVAQKVRVPSLAGLAQAGVDVPGLSNKKSPTTDKAAVGGDFAGTVMATPPRPPARSRTPLLVTGVAALLLGAGALALVNRLNQGPGEGTKGREGREGVDSVVPLPVRADAGTTAAPDAGGRAEEEVPPLHVDAGVVHATPAIHLTPELIQKFVMRQYARVTHCFDEHPADLPADSGRVFVFFTIEPSGRVSGVRVDGPVAETTVGQCLHRQVGAMTFPRNLDHGIPLKQPLDYHRVPR